MNSPAAKVVIDRSSSINIEPFIFRKVECEYQQTEHGLALKQIEPGTWIKSSQLPEPVLAIVCCPNCKQMAILHKSVSKIDKVGKVLPDFVCKSTKDDHLCNFTRTIYLDEYHNIPLYACAVEEYVNGKWKPDIIYTHASTSIEALKQLGIANYRVVAIGRAIGFFVHDKDGLKLSADGKWNEKKEKS